MGKAVAKKKETGSAVVAYDYGEDANAGFENQTGEDFAIPFLSVLQALSPQVADPSDGGVEGARPGMLFNTVTETVFDGKDGVEIIPALTEHVFMEWVPRKQGGGFVARHEINSDIVARAKEGAPGFGKYSTSYDADGQPNGNDLVETFYVYGVLVGETLEPIVIAFTSTKISVYKRFNTKLNMFTTKQGDRKIKPPIFAHRIRVTTVKQKNNEGEFFNFAMAPAEVDIAHSLLETSDPRFLAAKGCREMVASGAARASYETQKGGEGQPGDTAAGTPF